MEIVLKKKSKKFNSNLIKKTKNQIKNNLRILNKSEKDNE